ncbi:polysaccharide deacetylase [Daeguia caeni]|uniref:Chitooligosaccharide deacetylase n=1 Tax=Daeguia caeni TaxID=439612 RepID=A0ABV9H496_9HYPH
MTTVCLTFDFDAVSLWLSSFRTTSVTPVSRGEYGATVGLPRLLKLLDGKAVKATFFVPSHTAISYPAETRAIRDAGHEIALHGYVHETPLGLDRDEEARLLDASIARLRKVLGNDFTPQGYRSPAWDLSVNTIDLLLERGLMYDSSMMGDDFRPYFARKGDQLDDESFRPGETSALIEMPVAWELDDFPYFTFLNKPLYSGLRDPAEVGRIWQSEFDYCHEEVEGGVFTLTTHPQIIGRGPRIRMLGALIDHMKSAGDVRFLTMAEAAGEARSTLTAISSGH